jgi:glycerophosphoryl diester phosphodiesterase
VQAPDATFAWIPDATFAWIPTRWFCPAAHADSLEEITIAHRGASTSKLGEGTLPAYQYAVKNHAEILDADVHWTKDGPDRDSVGMTSAGSRLARRLDWLGIAELALRLVHSGLSIKTAPGGRSMEWRRQSRISDRRSSLTDFRSSA